MKDLSNLAFGICSDKADCTTTAAQIAAPFVMVLLGVLLVVLARTDKYKKQSKYLYFVAAVLIGWAVPLLFNISL